MKRKLLMLTALALCLALLCGCTTIATSEWMQNLFPVGDEAVAGGIHEEALLRGGKVQRIGHAVKGDGQRVAAARLQRIE